MCNDTAYMPNLSLKLFSLMRALTRLFNVDSEKESIILRKNAIILKLEKRLDRGNEDFYLLTVMLYAIPNYGIEMHLEGKNLEGITPTNME